MSMSIYIRLYKPISQIIKDTGLNDKTALYAAGEAKKLMDEYVPMKTGALCNTANISAVNNRGTVTYVQPYASSCYYGEKKKFNRDRHEKASAYWDKAMVMANKGVLTGRVNNYIKKIGS